MSVNSVWKNGFCLVAAVALAGCGGLQDQSAAEQAGAASEPSPSGAINQTADDLLAGVSTAVAYSGFRRGQHPDRGDGAVNPSDEEILEDLNILSRNGNFALIRLYDSQENSAAVLRVIKQHDLDLKVMLGIWLDAELSNHENCPWLTDPIPEEQLAANRQQNKRHAELGIGLANEYPEIVVAVNVGNEALVSWTDHLVSVDSIISLIRTVRDDIEQPVTVAEQYAVWLTDVGAQVAAELDFVSVQVYPVWEGKAIDDGLSYTLEKLRDVHSALPPSPLVISEAGWATVAAEFNERASEENQKRYVDELLAWAATHNVTTFVFEAFDEPWKGDPANPDGAEKHWGLFTVDRTPKLVMQDEYPDLMPKPGEAQ